MAPQTIVSSNGKVRIVESAEQIAASRPGLATWSCGEGDQATIASTKVPSGGQPSSKSK